MNTGRNEWKYFWVKKQELNENEHSYMAANVLYSNIYAHINKNTDLNK